MSIGVALLILVAWGALTFGAVYDWGYLALLAGAVIVGGLGVGRSVPRARRGINLPVLATIVVVGVAISAQLVPLDRATIVRLSPATDEFLRQYDLAYATRVAMDTRDRGVAPVRDARPSRRVEIVHPLSIHPEKTRLGLLFIAGFGVLLLGLTRGIGGRELRVFTPGLAGLGVLLSLIGVVQKALWNGKVYGFWQPLNSNTGAFGPFINRNHFAGWMLMAVPLVLAYFVAHVTKGMVGVKPDWRSRLAWFSTRDASKAVLMGFSVLVMTLALALTLSRSGIACLLLALLISGFNVLRRQETTAKQRWLVFYVGGAFVAALGWAGFDAVAARFAEMDLGLGGRAGAWADAWRIHEMFPVFGTGFNTYGTATLLLQRFQTDLVHFVEAHNDYLQILTEGGYWVAVPALALVGTIVWQVRARFRENLDDRTGYWLRLGAVTGIVAMAFQELVEFSLQMPGNFVLFTVLCAIAIRRATPKNSPKGHHHARPVGVMVLLVGLALVSHACGSADRNDVSVKASYAKTTGKLELLTYDTNKDGKADAWGHMDGSRLVRMEFDKDFNGVIDRWEYFTPAGVLEKVGMSKAGDGKVDAWAYPAADGSTARVEVSTKRDGRITRREFYERDQLSRAEEDTDGDGRVDKWETYDAGTLASVALDTDKKGTPDRRLTYGPDGVKLQKLR
jgi:O-antigen ligase